MIREYRGRSDADSDFIIAVCSPMLGRWDLSSRERFPRHGCA
jgi:hypothetical protein